MFASKTSTTLVFVLLILLSIYTLNANADACSEIKAKSEAARVSAENACAKAAEVAINSADSTKAVAKKACEDAKIIAKNVADKAAAAVCVEEEEVVVESQITSTEKSDISVHENTGETPTVSTTNSSTRWERKCLTTKDFLGDKTPRQILFLNKSKKDIKI